MTLRRYQGLRASRGTVWPPEVRREIEHRDLICVGWEVGFPVPWSGRMTHRMGLEIDHVRASHGMGMKSVSTVENGVRLCNACHVWKTEHGKEARPLLLEIPVPVLSRSPGLRAEGGGVSRVPAKPTESAFAFDVMRAALAGLLTTRKGYRLRVTTRQLERASGVMVRVGLRYDGSIDAWLEPPDPDMRHGVPYIFQPEPEGEQPSLFEEATP